MNLITLEPEDFIRDHEVILKDRRCTHIHQVLKSQVGDGLRIGLIDGPLGTGTITQMNTQQITLHVEKLSEPSTPPLSLSMIIALPRPRVLNRVLQTCATLGVQHIILIHTQRVEKSYWQTPLLNPDNVQLRLRLGLEQACSTHMPSITFYKRFHTFIHEGINEIDEAGQRFVAHPGHYPSCPSARENSHTTMAIGPEGGFIAKEIEQLTELGFSPVQVGPRIMRVETALTYLIAKLF